MGMLDSFFSPGEAYRKAAGEVEKGWNESKGYQEPYWQHGNEQYNPLMGAEGQLLDPAALQNKWGEGYEMSPYAQHLLGLNQQSGLDAASSMGLMGSSAALGNIQQGAGNIMQQDRQQYMNDLMQKFMTGIGLGQNLYGTGAQAGANLGNQAVNVGDTMAGLKYGQQAAPGKLLGQILGGVGGAVVGGPKGDNAFNGATANGTGSFG